MLLPMHIFVAYMIGAWRGWDKRLLAAFVVANSAPDYSFIQMLLATGDFTRTFFNHGFVSFFYVLPFGPLGIIGNGLHLLADTFTGGIPFFPDGVWYGFPRLGWHIWGKFILVPWEIPIAVAGIYAAYRLGIGKVAYTLSAFFLGYAVFALLTPLYLLNPLLATGFGFLVLWYLVEKARLLDRLGVRLGEAVKVKG
ncbi:hypothetical protein [Thermococcus sp. MAR1]|uniref:hypothetical protein n=1 Tax=Thermococcus sp. MAR1 TaxID=1638263 RepID=UPI00143AA30F|nr:hypothetical protein [Thermococcus sp. MAR1]NJE09955.1 hypothetical protein [Thermococcus sp. MAR1]